MEPTPLKLELVEIEDPSARKAPSAPLDDDITLAPDTAMRESLTIDIAPVGRPVPIAKGPPAKIDAYAQQASREYAQGHVDQPLWDRALTQAQGDKTAAAAIYVRARGTALRLMDRHRKLDATRPLPAPVAVDPAESRRVERRAAFERYRTPALAGIALALVAGVSVFYIFGNEAAREAAIAAPAPLAVAAPAATGAAAAATPAAHAKSEAAESLAALQTKIQALRDAGNWNVLVLYAVEWTRREPDNPAAWNQLRAGYVYLHQYEDALAAAKKAVALAPGDATLWRHLGAVNADIDDPPAAMAAFKEAVARDPADVASLQSIALLATRLGQPQEARAALDRALVAQPGDAVSACLRSGLPGLPPARDAYTAQRQVQAVDARCRGKGDGTAVAVK